MLTDGRTDGRTDVLTDRRKIGRLYRTLLQAGAIKSKENIAKLLPVETAPELGKDLDLS